VLSAEYRVLSKDKKRIAGGREKKETKMGRIERFEDLIAWQKARELTRLIHQICRQSQIGKDFGLRDQIQRACVSIMSNLAEGFERSSLGEFRQFISVAKGSCGEARSLLYVCLDVGYLDQPNFSRLMNLAEEVARIIGALRTSVAKKVLSIEC
jgi:four helix bundle protein